MKTMASVLLLDMEDKTQILLEQSFKARQEMGLGLSTVSRILEMQKIDEALTAVRFDMVIVDQNVMDEMPGKWREGFLRKNARAKDLPFIGIGHDSEPQKIHIWLEGGFLDYMIKPVDKALLIEKVILYTTGKRDRDGRQVYSLEMQNQTDVAKRAIIEELSEFDCRIKSQSPYHIGEIVTLYSKVFAEDFGIKGGEIGNVMGRCYHSAPHRTEKGWFESLITFVGIQAITLKNIRTSLRKEYIAKKS